MNLLSASITRLFFSSFAIQLVALGIWAQPPAQKLGSHSALKGASVSAVVVDLLSGEVLDSYRPDERLCPASVWKLLTTSAALELLGADFQFRTALVYQGHIEERVLHGDVMIIGGGDPSLASRHFGESLKDLLGRWASDLSALGVDSITGDVIGNAAHFQGDGIPRTRIWEDMANYYGAPVCGLNVHDNTYFIDFATAPEPDVPAQLLKAYPEVPGLRLRTEIMSSSSTRDMAYIFGAPGTAYRVVRGTLPLGRSSFTIKGSLPDPALFMAFHLRKQLLSNGIAVAGTFKAEHEALPEPALVKLIAEHRSPQLNELVRHTLVESDNLFAEALLMQLGARNGKGNIEEGLKVLEEHYAGLAGLDRPFFAYDGSGLSRFNAVSSSAVAQALVRAQRNSELKEVLTQALPLAGKEGTVKYFAKNTNLDGNMRLKSGSMDKVRAYAGTFDAFTGRELAFAVLVNNFDADALEVRKAIEQWLVAVYGDF